MPQILYVKDVKKENGRIVLDADGKIAVEEKIIQVLQSWSRSDGRQIFLMVDGSYGYKNGDPIRTREELDDPEMIGDEIQRKMAVAWWDRKGHKISRAFYDEKTKEHEDIAKKFTAQERVTDFDAILYQRRDQKSRLNAAYSDPETWHGFGFKDRPPWWGLMENGAINDGFYYRRVDPSSLTKPTVELDESAMEDRATA